MAPVFERIAREMPERVKCPSLTNRTVSYVRGAKCSPSGEKRSGVDGHAATLAGVVRWQAGVPLP